MSENIQRLLALIEENPELPIVPVVDAEICGDDYGAYMGDWGTARVDEYLIGGDMVLFRSDDDVFDVLERVMDKDDFDKLPDIDAECKKIYDALPWKRAIIVDITTAEAQALQPVQRLEWSL